MQNLAKTKKTKREGYSSQNKEYSSNKTWKKKATDEGNKSKKDLAAFVKKAIKTGVQKELSAKKRKSEGQELDLSALENVELKDFNYTDMGNLRINEEDSDDDESVESKISC